MDIFDEWRHGGTQIRWCSTTADNDEAEVAVFSRRCGTPGAPALVCVHGFPTSSIDYFALTRELGDEFDIFLLDFPGYGLSDKPPAPYKYSLYDDARLLMHAITNVWKLTRYTMLTHDRGTSVGMIASSDAAVPPTEVILTNANIFLPLANLTAFQIALLDPATARDTARATTPDMLAAGLGATTFTPRRTLDDPEIAALSRCFAHNDGIAVLPDTIQYLNERAADETSWLQALSKSGINTSLVWGLHDNVAPVRVANFVWHTFLKDKPGRNRYWIVPGADHYVQCDAPQQLAQVVRLTAADEPISLQTLGNRPDGAVLVDQTSSDGVADPGGDPR
ncbi:hydrolase [Mycobacterium sp. MFM001]|uniref:alpha/beta fold hydrolase n=1 Tax=Mycobacterium sp. MFM001 TaxID=2049453 RepID=UPI000DA51AD8|nr:alpha/beta fold hydrolase [Mycobacterium sp. MFM001]GBE66937.1 hydrolase [Mycobacterium sp. MFM001]